MDTRIFETLAAYHPVVTGTIPLAIDTPASDLDISLYAPDLTACAGDVRKHYGQQPRFEDHHKRRSNGDSYVARFHAGGFMIEFFAMRVPVNEHHGYRHLVVEARLLRLGGKAVRDQVRQLKRDGIKTEPAFAQVFGLEGDPYQALLALYELDDDALHAVIKRHKGR